MRCRTQSDDSRLEISAPFLGYPLDHNQYVEDPVVKQRSAILRRASLPYLPNVSRLVNDCGQSPPSIFVRTSESLCLAYGSVCCRDLPFGGMQLSDQCVVIRRIFRSLRELGNSSRERLKFALAIGQERTCLIDQALCILSPFIAVVQQPAHIPLEIRARALAYDQVLNLIFNLARVDAPDAAPSGVHLLEQLGLCATFGVRMSVAAFASLFRLVAPPVVFQSALCANGNQWIQLALSAVSAAALRSARGKSGTHVFEERDVYHRRPMCGHLMSRSFSATVGQILHTPDQRGIDE